MRENDAWFGHGSLRWWEEGGLTSVHYMLGPWKEDKDFVSSAYAKLDNTYGRLWVMNDKTYLEHNRSAFGCIATEQPFGEAC
jgi:hypothetical protein